MEEMGRSWAEMVKRVGLEVVDDEEVEQDGEDKEVEKILERGKGDEEEVGNRYVQILCQTVYSIVHVLILK